MSPTRGSTSKSSISKRISASSWATRTFRLARGERVDRRASRAWVARARLSSALFLPLMAPVVVAIDGPSRFRQVQRRQGGRRALRLWLSRHRRDVSRRHLVVPAPGHRSGRPRRRRGGRGRPAARDGSRPRGREHRTRWHRRRPGAIPRPARSPRPSRPSPPISASAPCSRRCSVTSSRSLVTTSAAWSPKGAISPPSSPPMPMSGSS